MKENDLVTNGLRRNTRRGRQGHTRPILTIQIFTRTPNSIHGCSPKCSSDYTSTEEQLWINSIIDQNRVQGQTNEADDSTTGLVLGSALVKARKLHLLPESRS